MERPALSSWQRGITAQPKKTSLGADGLRPHKEEDLPGHPNRQKQERNYRRHSEEEGKV